MANIFLTGGAGYIGSHVARRLLADGHNVVVYDNMVRSSQKYINRLDVALIVGDLSDYDQICISLSEHDVDVVMHFASYAYVGESVTDPALYYSSNVSGTINLLNAMRVNGVNNIIFSSSCAVYGAPLTCPILEEALTHPINPYGRSKLFCESIIRDYSDAYGFNYLIFRYFNASGASFDALLGECHSPETHIIPNIFNACVSDNRPIVIYGKNHDTPDGTCIRDYIHVVDLAEAHALGVAYINLNNKSQIINLGTGFGISVLDLISKCSSVLGKDIPVIYAPGRVGDPPMLYCGYDKANKILGWSPRNSNLEKIITSAWNFFCNENSLNRND